jgi:pimeloyl-ACP methyl ester carboxylesterase
MIKSTRKNPALSWLGVPSGLLCLFGASTTHALTTTVPPPPPLAWAPCSDSPTRECATLAVPLDYDDLSKGTVGLLVVRARATGVSTGTLLYNPGGPGQVASDTIKKTDYGNLFTANLLSHFDLVGFDPRGTFDGLFCMTPELAARYWENNQLPRTDAELNARISIEKEINQHCRTDNPPLVNHVDTASAIRDMESLRLAMHLDKFNFMGRSYGTFMGYRYAQLYPGHLRALVLDAVVDHSVSDEQSIIESAAAFDLMWTKFKQWCPGAPGCHFHGQNLDTVWTQLVAGARLNPIPAPRAPITQRPVNDAILTVMAHLFSSFGDITFNWVDQLIYEATRGDASFARAVYDNASGAQPDGTYLPGSDIHRTIVCVDTVFSQILRTPHDIRELVQETQDQAPRFGETIISEGPTQCVGYPIAPVEPPPLPAKVLGTPPTLLVGGTLDSETPIVWASRMSEQIAHARLLKRNGYGHISYDKSRCVQQYVDSYLVNLTLPPPGTVCPTDPDLYPVQDPIFPPL